MTDLLPVIEKYHALRTYALTRRFFPFVAVCFFAAISGVIGDGEITFAVGLRPVQTLVAIGLAGLFWLSSAEILPHEKWWLRRISRLIDECCFVEAERKLTSPPWFAGFATRVRRLQLLARLKLETGDLIEAYVLLTSAEQETLLPNERLSIQLAKANLLFQAGNYAAFRKLVAEGGPKIYVSKPLYFRYLLLKSLELELDGFYKEAKSLLEEAISVVPEAECAAIATNNLARLEDVQGNHTNAQSYYERSWHLLQTKSLPCLHPVIAHNLLLKYARSGDSEKALSLLDDYRTAVTPGNVEQYIKFLNNQVDLARQLDDRTLLLDAYERAGHLKSRLNKNQCLVQAVCDLRMRLNDRIDFVAHLTETANLLDEFKVLPLPERFHVLSEFLAVLKQCNLEQVGEQSFNGLVRHTITALLAMEKEIEEQLRNISPALPAARDTWYSHKIQLNKLKMCLSDGISHSSIENLFNLLCERRRVWSDKGNAER